MNEHLMSFLPDNPVCNGLETLSLVRTDICNGLGAKSLLCLWEPGPGVHLWKFSVLSLSQEGNEEVSAESECHKASYCQVVFFESVIASSASKVDSDSFACFNDVSVCDVLGQAKKGTDGGSESLELSTPFFLLFQK